MVTPAFRPELAKVDTERRCYIRALISRLRPLLRPSLRPSLRSGLEDDSEQSEESRSGWFEGMLNAVEPKAAKFRAAINDEQWPLEYFAPGNRGLKPAKLHSNQ